MTYTPRARRLATFLAIAIATTILVVLAMTQDRPYDHFRSTPVAVATTTTTVPTDTTSLQYTVANVVAYCLKNGHGIMDYQYRNPDGSPSTREVFMQVTCVR